MKPTIAEMHPESVRERNQRLSRNSASSEAGKGGLLVWAFVIPAGIVFGYFLWTLRP